MRRWRERGGEVLGGRGTEKGRYEQVVGQREARF